MTSVAEELNSQGFVWFRGALDERALSEISSQCEFGAGPGYRPKANAALISLLRAGCPLGDLSRLVLPNCQPVRLVAFNKSQSSNWAVPWHQDRVIAVSSKHEVHGFSNWGRRSDYWHVEPPIEMLSKLVFARIHFDRTTLENGAMELAVGSHHLGGVAASDAKFEAEACPTEVCEAEPGDVLFVSGLTLHRSKVARIESERRALRVDYSAAELPDPLQWAFAQ